MNPSARSHTVLRSGAALALALTGLVGQAAHADNLNPILGGGLGAMAGAFIGQSMGGRDGAMVGAAVGGLAGVSIASNNERRHEEPVRTVVYNQPYRQAPVYAAPVLVAPVYARPVYAAPVVVAPAYRYRAVERVNYYPVRGYGHRGWDGHGRDRDQGSWGHRDGYRQDDPRGGDHRGWSRRD